MNLLMGILLATLTTTAAPPVDVASASREKTPIFLHTDASDAVGATCVARFRQALQGSSAYRPVTTPTDARFVVGIVTMDPNEAESDGVAGRSTVAAVTLQRESAVGLNEYVYSWVVVARHDRVDAVVAEVLAAIDREIRDLEEATRQAAPVVTGL